MFQAASKCLQGKRLEAELGAPGRKGLDDAAHVVTYKAEAGCLRFFLHCPPQSSLSNNKDEKGEEEREREIERERERERSEMF